MSENNEKPEAPELLPCPWCNGPANLTAIKGSPTNPFLASCQTSRDFTCPMSLAMTPDEWNSRASSRQGELISRSEAVKTLRDTIDYIVDEDIHFSALEALDVLTASVGVPQPEAIKAAADEIARDIDLPEWTGKPRLELAETVAAIITKHLAGSSVVPESSTAPAIPTQPEWRCFHCDEVFTTREAASEHFGDGDYEDEPPICVEAATTDKRELASTNRKLWKDLQEALAENESLEDRLNNFKEAACKVTKKPDANYLDIEQAFDSLEGQLLATKEPAPLLSEAVRIVEELRDEWKQDYYDPMRATAANDILEALSPLKAQPEEK